MKQIILITILIVGLTATYGFADMDDYMRGQGHMGSGIFNNMEYGDCDTVSQLIAFERAQKLL